MNKNMIQIGGQIFKQNASHFSFHSYLSEMSELEKLKEFPNLRSASFTNSNLNDLGLKYACENTAIENLNLQATQISDNGIVFLSQLKNLQYLRLKENYQLTNDCIKHINQLSSLIDLQIHETSIDQNGLKQLVIIQLESLIVEVEDIDCVYDFLIILSRRLSSCNVLVKGKAEFYNGKVLWTK